ncbi:MAG: DUF5074 domain-containing protein [Dyadobacter sp.]
MKKQLLRILTISSISATLWSCNQSDPIPKGTYVQGVFVINEGNFSQNNGAISFFAREKTNAEADVFSVVNGNALPGGVQGYDIAGEHGIILVDNSAAGQDKVQIVNANTFAAEATISTDIENPRDVVAVTNDKAYVTCWNTLNSDYSYPVGYVAVIDLTTNKVIKKISTDKGPEKMIFSKDKVFVGDYAYSGGNKLTVISTSSDAILSSITFKSAPNPIGVDINGKLWVQAGIELFRLNTETFAIETTLKIGTDVTKTPGNFAMSSDLSTIYFVLSYSDASYVSHGATYKFSINDTQINVTTPFINRIFSGLAVDPTQGLVYAAVTPSYLQAGYAVRYRGDGTLVDSVKVGVAPTGFYFKQL